MKLFYQKQEMNAILDVYLDIFPRMEYVMTFQEGSFLAHELHFRQVKLFSNFLSFFIKPSELFAKTAAELQLLPLETCVVAKKELFLPLTVQIG